MEPTNEFGKIIQERYIKEGELRLFFNYSNIDFRSTKKFAIMDALSNNLFLTESQRERVKDILYNIQRLVHSVCRLKYMWQYKRANVYNTDDLYMNPFCPGQKNVVVLLQNKTKYVFHKRELLNVIQTSLSNCCHYFPEPIVCKNPYTNLPFNKSALYNIYFALRASNYRISPLFESFFQYNFNYTFFLNNNEEAISDEYLKTYVENHCLNDILEFVRDMFEDHNMKCNIHKHFPKERLMFIMKPYLTLYFMSKYALNIHKKMRAKRILHQKLHKFVSFNPGFGKKKVKLISNNKRCEYFFEEKCIPFHDIKTNDHFMNSHLDTQIPTIIVEPMRMAPSSSSFITPTTIRHYTEHPLYTFDSPNEDESDDESEPDEPDEPHIYSIPVIVMDDEDEDEEDDEEEDEYDSPR